MKPTDSSGNMLELKDYVAIHVSEAVLKGVVTQLKEAATIMSKDNEISPGAVTITIPITLPFAPGQFSKLKDVYKLVKPPGFDGIPGVKE